MTLWTEWMRCAHALCGAGTRHRTSLWLMVVLLAWVARPDLLGVTSFVRASFLDSEGKACRSVPSGGALHVRIEFVAHQRIERPVFGLAIYRNDGTHVNGPNTQLAGLPIEYIDGPGTVEYKVERIPLLPGGYTLSAAIYDWEGLHAYDHWHQAFPLVIEPGETNEVYGLIQMPACWRFASGGVEVEHRTG